MSLNINRILDQVGGTEIEFAEKIGITHEELKSYINGDKKMSSDMLGRIVDYTGLRAEEINNDVIYEKLQIAFEAQNTIYSKEMLEKYIYELNSTLWFKGEVPVGYIQVIGFLYDNSLPSRFLVELQDRKIIEGEEHVIAILGDWENLAEGIVFTDKALYVNSSQNVNKRFRAVYHEISELQYNESDRKLLIYVNGEKWIINTKLWNIKSIYKFLQFACKEENSDNKSNTCSERDYLSEEINYKVDKYEGKIQITKEQKKKCNAIIHTAAVAAGGVGANVAQVPLSDNILITPIQITMITSLGAVFDIRVTEGVAKGIIGSAAASVVGRSIVQVAVGWIPVVGNTINTATAAAITELIGWIAVEHFLGVKQKDRAKYKVDGMKEGCINASREYEKKLKKQAEKFIKEVKSYEKQKDEYELLLSEYEKYIVNLEKKDKTEEEILNLNGMKSEYEAVLELKKS